METDSTEIRVKRTNAEYKAINRSAANNKNLSLQAKGVMFYLLAQSSTWKGQVYDITLSTSSSKYTVSKAIKELVVAGYIKRKFDKQDGLFTGSHYVVCDEIPPSI